MNITLRRLTFASVSFVVLFACAAVDAQQADTASLYDRLADEATASTLALTDDQKSAVARVMQERDAAFEAAENDEAKATVRADAQAKLAALLTPEQETQFTALFNPPTIQFNFRFQKWADVLPWIANEAGLSLVMEEAPEGTFNYSDRRQYKPDEAIDLLNGWLMIKGYTLIRRNQLLMCVSLKDGIPDGTVPRVALEDLPGRGRFEFVSVLIPLEARAPETVMAEIEPLSSAWGQAKPLAATKQLLVTDAADIVRTIQKVVELVPPPKAAPKPDPKPPAPKPELKIYPLQHANPEKAGEVIKELVSGSLVVDAEANQISINAVPAEQAKVQAIIDQLEANQGRDKQADLKSYPAETDSPDNLVESVKLAVPSATVRYDSVARRLVAFATAEDHQRITAALLELETRAAEREEQLAVHPLKDVDPTVAQQLIVSVLPDVRVTVDSRTSTLIAVGRLSELKAVKTLLDQLQPEAAGLAKPVLQPYPLDEDLAQMAVTVIPTVAPDATVTPDPANKRLLVVALPRDHEAIAAALTRLTEDVTEKGLQLESYDSRGLSYSSVSPLLQALVPGVQLIDDSANERLIAIAAAEDHAKITNVLEQVRDNPETSEPKLQFYPLPEDFDVQQFNTLLSSFSVQASVTVDDQNNRLMVTATARDHGRVAELLEQLVPEMPAEKPQLKSYPLPPKVDSGTITTMLASVAAKAQVRMDAANKRLLITATEEDHAAVADLLQKLTANLPDTKRQLKTYPLPEQISSATVTSTLSALAPEATVTIDDASKQLLVTATARVQETVAAALDQLGGTDGNRRELKSYPLKASVDLTTATSLLNTLAPEASVTSDAMGHRLLITASPKDHATIGAAIAQITQDARGELPELEYYPLEKVDGDYAVSILKAIVPAATAQFERETKRLSVIASPSDHELLRQTLAKLEAAAPESEKRELKVYSVTKSQRARFNSVLQGLTQEIPGLQVLADGQPGEMIIWAKPSHHEIVSTVLQQLDGQIPEDQKPSLVVYPITVVEAEGVAEVLTEIFPDASVKVDSRASRLLVRARPAMQKTIKSAIEQLDADVPEGREIKLMVYPVKGLNADSALALITEEVPRVTVIRDDIAQTFIVRGRLEEHQEVAEILDTLRSSPLGKRIPVVYPSFHSDADEEREFFQRAFPESQVVVDSDAGTLTVIATVEDQKLIKETIDQLSSAEAEGLRASELQVYTVRGTVAANLQAMLAQSVPRARVVIANDQLLTWAQPADQLVIRQIVEGLKDASGDRQLTVFDISQVDVAVAQNVLATVAPQTSFLAGQNGRALIATVDATTKAEVEAALAQLAESPAARQEQTLKFYPVEKAAASSVQSVLSTAVPEVTFLLSTDGTRLFARVTEYQHQKIEETLARINDEKPFDSNRTLETYSIAKSGPYTATVLQRMVPSATVTAGAQPQQLMVEATAADHDRVRQLMTQLEEAANDSSRELKFYNVEPDSVGSVRSTLAAIVPEVALTASTDNTRLIAQVTEEQHQKITAALEQLEQEQPFRSNRVLKFYAVSKSGANTASVLTRLVPSAIVSPGTSAGQLMVEATPAQHGEIAAVITQLETAAQNDNLRVRFYAVDEGHVANTRSVIAAVAPEVSLTASTDNTRLIAVVNNDQHAKIIGALESLAEENPFQSNRVLQFYSAAGAGNDTITVLQRMVPTALINTGTQTDQLMVEATEAEHEEISDLLNALKVAAQDDARSLKYYEVNRDQLPNAQEIIVTAVPGIDVKVSADGTRLIALVTVEQDEKITATLEQLATAAEGAPRRTTSVFDIAGTDPTAIEAALSPFVTTDQSVQITVDAVSRKVYVRAFEDRQHDIRDAITQIMAGVTDGSDSEVAAYFVGDGNGDEVQEALAALYPDATIVTDRSRRMIIATATPQQQKQIKVVAEQMKDAQVIGSDAIPRTYDTQHLDGIYLRTVMRSLFPRDREFVVSVDIETGQVVAVCTPQQHETIRELLEQIDQPTQGTATTLQVYKTGTMTPTTVIAALEPLVSRQTTLSSERNKNEIVVSATAEEQERIAGLLEQMGITPEEIEKTLGVYRVAPLDTRTVITALQPVVSDNVTLSADRTGQEIVVGAPAEEQKKIATLIEQMRSHRKKVAGVQIRSYTVGRGKADDAMSILRPMFPDAILATDRRYETLVATALPEDHETIAEVVKQISGRGDVSTQPVAQTYLMRQYDGNKMRDLLNQTFTTADDVRVTWDDRNKRIIAVARPDQQNIIAGIVNELDPTEGPNVRYLKEYRLTDLDLGTVNHVVNGAVRNIDPGAQLGLDQNGEKLMVTTHERGHEVARKTIARFTPYEPTQLRVFQLTMMTPWEAHSAIDRMITRRIHHDQLKPDVHADDNLQQLWVRATADQLKQIEDLLVQLGEVGVAGGSRGSDANLRVVPVGNDVTGALERIEKLWPRIRKNPIRVLNPGEQQPAPTPQDPQQQSTPAQFSVPPEDVEGDGDLQETATLSNRDVTEDEDPVVNRLDPGFMPGTDPKESIYYGPRKKPDSEQQPQFDGTDPVIIVPGNGRITIASDDTDALNQMESLLRTIFAQGTGGTSYRDFAVHNLRNTAATDVAATIQQILDETDGITHFGNIAVVPEERLNALIVYGNRADRRRLEPLLEILDSEKFDNTRAFQTQVVPLKYSSANRIEDILQGIYRVQMTAGGPRSSLGIPSGVPAEVATVLRQINASASAPLLTIEVQRETNSLIIKAPSDLLEEVAELVAELDNAVRTNRANGVTLLPLKKSSSVRVMEILNRVLN